MFENIVKYYSNWLLVKEELYKVNLVNYLIKRGKKKK